MNNYANALEEVLKTWPGTPEELGATLHQATATIYGYTLESRKQEVKTKYSARKKILNCKGGKELLKLEETRP